MSPQAGHSFAASRLNVLLLSTYSLFNAVQQLGPAVLFQRSENAILC